MADLLTTIAMDDAELRNSLARIEGRLTNFSQHAERSFSDTSNAVGQLRGGFKELHHIMGGFGALALVGHLNEFVAKIKEAQEEEAKLFRDLDELGRKIQESHADAIASLQGKDTREDSILKRTAKEAKEVSKAAEEAKKRLDDVGVAMRTTKAVVQNPLGVLNPFQSPWGRLLEIIKSSDDSLERKAVEKAKDIRIDQTKKSEKAEAEELINTKRREFAKDVAGFTKDITDFTKQMAEEGRDLRREMGSGQVSVLKGMGMDRESELAALAESTRKQQEHVYDNVYLSKEEKSAGSDYYEALFDVESKLINAKYRQQAEKAMKPITYQSEGAGFGQQLEALVRSGKTDNQKLLDAVKSGFDRMQQAAARIGGTVYAP